MAATLARAVAPQPDPCRTRGAHRRRRGLVEVAALTLAVSLAGGLVGACGNDNERPSLASEADIGDPTTTVTGPTTTIAQAAVDDVPIYDSPDAAEPSRTYENPWHVNNDPDEPTVPLVFLVEEQRDDGWVEVLLPERPNGTTGWVRADDFTFSTNSYRITVELGAHHLTVYRGDDVILEDTVAIGKQETPTPPGKYYIRVLLESPDPDSVYGRYAYGLSAHSDVLYEFNGGDGEIGIHGNNDSSVLGKSVSAGCVRMSNEGIEELTKILPLGTPVEIIA